MAQVVLGLGTSHSPQLSTPPDPWWRRHAEERDKLRKENVDKHGQLKTYDELVAVASPDIEKELTPEVWQTRWDACQAGIARVAEALAEADPDILVMVGDDQNEIFSNENMPALLVYWGDTVVNTVAHFGPNTPEPIKAAAWGRYELDHDREYPVASDLGRHVITYLMDHDFDVSHSRELRPGQGIGHAFGHVFRRVMDPDHIIPTLPIMLNDYYPPNQPTPKRCYDLGRALRGAIEAWDSDARVGILGSGGLTHFVIDEELDRMVLKAMQEKDAEKLMSLPRHLLNSGTSEIRNWIVTAAAVEHLDMELFDYVPCYRSPAETGTGMAFARWA